MLYTTLFLNLQNLILPLLILCGSNGCVRVYNGTVITSAATGIGVIGDGGR
ncbi:MAG: hypothetical protein EZS28_048084, partial [Streblomastix strix]